MGWAAYIIRPIGSIGPMSPTPSNSVFEIINFNVFCDCDECAQRNIISQPSYCKLLKYFGWNVQLLQTISYLRSVSTLNEQLLCDNHPTLKQWKIYFYSFSIQYKVIC